MIGGFPPNESSDRGASAVEYGLVIAAIAALIVTIVFAFGRVVQSEYVETCEGLDDAFNNPTVTCAP